MPKMTFTLVLILGNGLALGLGGVVMVVGVSFSNDVFHVGDNLRLPKTARGTRKVDRKTLAIANGSVAGSFSIKTHIDNDAPMLVRGEGPPAKSRPVESEDMAQ